MTTSEGAILCNDYRRPELWYPLYVSILNRQPETPQKAIQQLDPLGVWSKKLKGAYEALKIVEIISLSEERPTIERLDGMMSGCNHPLDEDSFRIWILSNIRRKTKIEDGVWDKQSHFLLTYKHAVSRAKRILKLNDDAFLKELNIYLEREKCPVKMNKPKLHYWMMIAGYLGLVHKSRGGVIVSLDSNILWECIKRVSAKTKESRYPFDQFIGLLDKNFFFVPLEAGQEHPILSPVISQALFEQVNRLTLKLGTSGDRGFIQLDGIPSPEGGKNVFTDIEVRR